MWITKSASAGCAKWALRGLMAVVMLMIGSSAYAQRPSNDDGVRLITQGLADRGGVTTDDAPGFPVTISEAGSYRLGSNLVVPDANTTAVHITAANVTLDLNGFGILGPATPGGGVGVRAPFPALNVTVRNGVVRGMGSTGIVLSRACTVEGVRVRESDTGIAALTGCNIVNNNVSGNRGVGIRVQSGTVIGNVVTVNAGIGLELGAVFDSGTETVGYVHNVVRRNNGGDANPQVTGGVQMGGNICGEALCP